MKVFGPSRRPTGSTNPSLSSGSASPAGSRSPPSAPPGSLEGFGHLGSWESAQVRIQPDGSAIIYTGASPHGQGTATTLAQIAADELGIDFDRISVRHGDTATVVQGIGTMGSRITAIAGESVKQASAAVVAKARHIAAHLLEANPDDLEVAGDAFGWPAHPTTV